MQKFSSGTNSESPCDGSCIIDPKTDYCKSCFRTMNEIMEWLSFTYEQRKDVLKKVEARKLSEKNKSDKSHDEN
ncbi:MAG: DUF1289 domain-containing protein [Ignavibacteriales bacterium]|nr:DUF1289 domain-containing protein [Ignavibacteriales bacterium]